MHKLSINGQKKRLAEAASTKDAPTEQETQQIFARFVKESPKLLALCTVITEKYLLQKENVII